MVIFPSSAGSFVCIISCFYISLNLAVDNRLSFEASTGSITVLFFLLVPRAFASAMVIQRKLRYLTFYCYYCYHLPGIRTCAGLCNYILIYLLQLHRLHRFRKLSVLHLPHQLQYLQDNLYQNIDSYCSCNSYVKRLHRIC